MGNARKPGGPAVGSAGRQRSAPGGGSASRKQRSGAGQPKPASGQARPSSGQPAPASGQARPSSGQPAPVSGQATSASAQRSYPGQQFGRPRSGPGSLAGIGRRLAALFIDWLLCMVIAMAITRSQAWTIVVFAIEDYLLTALTGVTVGKRLAGVRVIRTDGRPVGPVWALVRTLLLLAVVPPLLMDKDLRGLHDRAADAMVVRI